MTQALLYKGILSRRPNPARPDTLAQIHTVALGVKTRTSSTPTTESIWRSIRSKDISRNIRVFLWKSLHDAHRNGSYWRHIPGYEIREFCPACENAEESLEHTLLYCDASGQKTIWALARQLWEKKNLPWPAPSLGSLLGCGIVDFRDPQLRRKPGANRLYTILISESL